MDSIQKRFKRPQIMGILNVTPDSFSDGGRYLKPLKAVDHALQMVEEGAEIIDIGGESSRPGADPVDPQEEMRRVIPVIEALVERLPEITISVDTYRAEVAKAALDAGATMLNDITAGTHDPEMLRLAATYKVPICLMHMQKNPKTMQNNPHYDDVVEDVSTYLMQRAEAAIASGCEASQIIVDPGIGFGKTIEHNLRLISTIQRLTEGPYRVLLGVSRKSFLQHIPNQRHPLSTQERDLPTAALSGFAAFSGVSIVRVHNVSDTEVVVNLAHELAKAYAPPNVG